MRAARRARLPAAVIGCCTAGFALLAMPAQGAPGFSPAGAAGSLLRGLPPPSGHYDAQLCVTVGPAPPDCGPVSADIDDEGRILVRVSDIAYRLEAYADQLGVSLFHGTMQVDGFFAPYQWSGNQLQFRDTEKATRYELKLGTRRFDGP